MSTINFHWTNIDNIRQSKPTWVALENVNHTVNWLPIWESSLFGEELLEEDILEEAKEQNDVTGRMFEWGVVKAIYELKYRTKDDLPDTKALKKISNYRQAAEAYENWKNKGGEAIPKHIEDTAEKIISLMDKNKVQINSVTQIGTQNGTSHGDICINDEIGIELKYVKSGSGTWHNTKTSLLQTIDGEVSRINNIEKLMNFIQPNDVLYSNDRGDNSTYVVKPGVTFNGDGKTFGEQIKAALAPFSLNVLQPRTHKDGTTTMPANPVSLKTSKIVRHGTEDGRDISKGGVRREDIIIKTIKPHWKVNGGKEIPLSTVEVYDTVISQIGNKVMKIVITDHFNKLASNEKYLKLFYKAILQKQKAKTLESKLPEYFCVCRAGNVQILDCAKFMKNKENENFDVHIDWNPPNSQVAEGNGAKQDSAKVKKTTPKDIEALDEVGADTEFSNTSGFYIWSNDWNISFKVQYYWKNGTGLNNPVIIAFLNFMGEIPED